MRSVLLEAFSQGVGCVRSATTPIIRHILGGVDEVVGGNVVRWAFSQGVGCVRSATMPIIRHIPGGVENEGAGKVMCEGG